MNKHDLDQLTLASAARIIRAGQLSPVELTRAILDRIGSLNDRMAIFITVTADHAMARAKAAERALKDNDDLGPLHGIPISLKDLFDTKGIRTTAGSRVFEDRYPEQDSTVTSRLNAAGAILVGKANLHEFAFGVTSVNPHYGAVRNPWDPDRISGGSSGGSATSIALSVALGSMGSDTGGSIRIPAGLTGTVGLKPTYGRISVAGVVPLSWSLDHVGPMTRTVEDAAIMLEILAGHDPGDAYSRKVPVTAYSQQLEGGIRGLRLGLPRTTFYNRLDPEVERAVQTAVNRMEEMGASVVDVNIPNADLQRPIFSNIAAPEAFSFHEQYLNSRPELYGQDIRARIEAGRLLLSVDFVRAQRARSILKKDLQSVFDDVDLLVTPTLPIPAPLIEQKVVEWDGETEPVLGALTRNTRLFNITGLPAITVPCGFTSNQLPIGLQIAGRAFDEATVLRAAHTYEQDAGWFERRPEL
jgi:aspartyl-tRNA(Asn)/glutamyl-tRNA(Gln) amidotransferase subunit A